MIPYGRHYLDDADIAAVVTVLKSGALTQGPLIPEFEQAIASYVSAKYAVAVSSGTAALHLACLAAGFTQGDNVITSPNTFVASANCVAYVNACPGFSDIDSATLNLSPVVLDETCKKLGRVKGIIPVHFAGLPCDMPAIKQIAERYGSTIIEDASHALGASYKEGGRVGNCAYSDMTVFSFHPVKLIAAGEGGMITTNNEQLYRKLLLLRSHGIVREPESFMDKQLALNNDEPNSWYYEMQCLGYNYRITDIQAALAISQLNKLDAFIARRRVLVGRYDMEFADSELIQPTQKTGRALSAHHLYVIRIPFDKLKFTRNELMRKLRNKGIGTQVHYIPVHLHPYYQSEHASERFPNSLAYYNEALSIPLFYGLSDDDHIHVIQTLKEILH